MIISRTPFRISFFGGATDYPAWYREHGGAVIATTINKYCYISARYLPPFFEHRYRVVYSHIENCQTPDEITHPAVREILKFLDMEQGVEIHHDGDLPARSGMGTSSSFTVGLLKALHALKGQMVSKRQLADEGIHVEQDLLQEIVGSQDQVLASYGGLNRVTFLPSGEIDVHSITIPSARIAELNSGLMLFYTGIKRTASNIASSYVGAINSRERQLHRIRAMVDEACELLSSSDDLSAFGEMLHEAWENKRLLSSIVTNPEVDAIYTSARDAGAVGGKLIGAGGGGFLLVYARPEKHEAIKTRLNRLIEVPFKFETNGSQIIFYDPEEDHTEASNARRVSGKPLFHELDDLGRIESSRVPDRPTAKS